LIHAKLCDKVNRKALLFREAGYVEGEKTMTMLRLGIIAFAALWTGTSHAESCKAMTTSQLSELTANGIALKLGGEGQGYVGDLKLKKDGTGKGGATTDSGKKIDIKGTWYIANDKFCRTWAGLNDGQEVCEKWCLTSGNSVDVYNGKKVIGVNSW
jgi:hypothetical protein